MNFDFQGGASASTTWWRSRFFAELHLCVVYTLCTNPNSQTARLLNFEDRVRYGIII